MRTTLNLEEDVLVIVRRHARRSGVSLGKAVSDLIRKGAHQPLQTVDRGGLKIPRVPEGSPRVTSEQVANLLEDIP